MRLIQRFWAGVLAATLTVPSAGALAAGHDTGEALGAMRAIFYHELGHGLIDVFDLDTVGAEENVVDEFSTMMLIFQGRYDDRNIESLMSTARFWYMASANDDRMPFYAEHEFNSKRFFAVVCLMHGSDPGRFYPMMAELEIPTNRARRCEFEYGEKSENWVNILSPYVHGTAPADWQSDFAVYYEPAGRAETQGPAGIWKQSRFLEGLANEARNIFALPRDVPIVARDCGTPNAYWDGTSITLCYEMHSYIEGMFADARAPKEQPTTTTTSGSAGVSSDGSQNVGSSLGQSN